MYEWSKPHLSRSLAIMFESLTFYSLPSVRFFPSPPSLPHIQSIRLAHVLVDLYPALLSLYQTT